MVEIREILADIGMPVLSMKEAGIEADVVEDGTTFEENALIKAKEIGKLTENCVVLADDSGLEIDYLNKEPGIYSARYAGVDTSYDIKNNLLAVRLAVCELALPEGETCPLIIDDALVNLDETRLEQAMALLREIAKERQIILFSCRKTDGR